MAQLLKQRYLIIANLGQGGMGTVYKAEDIQLGNRFVAVKEMSQNGLNPQEVIDAAKAFEQEAHILAVLHHPHLPSIHEYFEERGRWYLVMEFIEGETLEAYRQAQGGKLDLQEVLNVGIQLCTILGYLHTHQPPIIFRDLKPLNIMRASDGHLYLIDFGIARHFKPGQMRDTAIAYSKGYAAPEQYGQAQTTIQSDIYSLGAMLHHLLSGNHPALTPFCFAPLKSQGQGVLTQINALIMQMVEMDAGRRPANTTAIEQELQRIATQQTTGQINVSQSAGKIPLPPRQTVPPIVKERSPIHQKPLPSTLLPPIKTVGKSIPPFGLWQGFLPTPRPLDSQKRRFSHKRRKALQLGLAGLGITATGIGLLTIVHRPPVLSAYTGYSTAFAWSPDGKYIASGAGGPTGVVRTVQIWEALTGKVVSTLPPSTTDNYPYLEAIAWSPDGKYVASGVSGEPPGVDKTVQVGDAFTGKIVSELHLSINGAIDSIVWLSDGMYVISTSTNGVQANKIDANNIINTYTLLAGNNNFALAFWSFDKMYIALPVRGKIGVWNTASWKHVADYTTADPIDGAQSVAWSPDGKYIASGASNGILQVREVGTNKLIRTFNYTSDFNGLSLIGSHVIWSPDGKYIACGTTRGRAHVWEILTGNIVTEYTFGLLGLLNIFTNSIEQAAWSPDGKYIAWVVSDSTIKVCQAV